MVAELGQDPQNAVASHLQDLVLDAADVHDFLQELVTFSASMLSARGKQILCGITVARRKKPVTVVSNDPKALAMDELQYGFGDGPCLSAMRTTTTMHVPDVLGEHRWPEYISAVSAHGIGSILGLPLPLERGATAALNLYSPLQHGFTGEDIAGAESFAEQTAKTLRLELRLAQMSDAKNDMAEAMKSRTTIDMAIGAIMAQNRCSQDAALQILMRASNSRNVKLRDVAASVIASITDNTQVRTHFDE
ncbi:GAF and ANTAR domain-containing protein [Arthrobacter sp. R1-13]